MARRAHPWCNASLTAAIVIAQTTKICGRDDYGFVGITAIALNAAIRGPIFPDPEACFVLTMAACLLRARAARSGPSHAAIS